MPLLFTYFIIYYMKKFISNFYLPSLLGRIFTKSNLSKVIILFLVGFTSRFVINDMYNVNVFIEYLSTVSIIYYICISLFVVLLHEIVTYFEINIIPSFIYEFFEVIYKYISYL